MTFFKNLIWGKKPVTSRVEFKYAMLRGDFAIIILAIGVFYIILDSVNNVFVFIPWYCLMIATCVVAMIYNRKRKYTISTLIILLCMNFLIYIFADVDHPDGGVFFFFMSSSMASLILLSYYKSRIWLTFAFLPIVMGYLAYFFQLDVVPEPSYEGNMVQINFLSNFTISVCSTIFMVRFLINRNHESEQELVERNQLLEKANKELDHFVYSVSHDLRAPLSSILGLANIYTLAKDDAERSDMVRMIHERATSLDAFIREVLDYSRNARTELRIQTVAVRPLINEVIQSMQFITGAEEINISIDIDADLVVTTDRERMKVILSNIISNAVYYRDINKVPSLKIESSVASREWIITIKDNGIGIKAEHLDRIFEMFYKAHDRAQGTGLGLYIVKETLQRLDGTIGVESEYGEGTVFRIRLKAEG
ncbi:hypothetical protein BH09BAC3_BH09BAC3_29630 [soil metagenome]